MAYLSMLLQQDVNKLYPDILNHEISPPPHWPGRVSHTFFLKRRPGLNTQIDFGGDKVLDYLQYSGSEYGLVKDATNIKIYRGATLLSTKPYSTAVNHKLFTIGGPSGTKRDEGTGASSNVTGGVFTITDATKAWTVNAFSLKWIYIYSADTGTGQVLQIISNTATELTLYSGWIIQPTNISYKIFDDYSEIVAFIGNDGIYAIHNDSEVIKLNRYGTVVDCVYTLGRLFVVDSNNNVLVSEEGTNCYYYGQPIGTYGGVLGMTTFQDFVLMLGADRIGMIKRETISLDGDSNPIETFKTLTISNTVGTFNRKSFTTHNQGLYIFTAIKSLVALTITPAGTDRFIVSEEDQGIYIQQFLDSIGSSDDVGLAINSEKIYLTHSSSSENNIYLYDTYYKFRYRWNTLLPVHGTVLFNYIYFLGDIVYKIDEALVKDLATENYIPRIKSILGEEDIFSLKTYMMHKLYIGSNTDEATKLKYVCHVDGGKYEVETDFKNIKYISDATLYNSDGTWGRDMFGYGIFGGTGFSISDYILGAVNTVEFPVTLTASMVELYIEGDIEFGGQMMQYELYDPHITPLNSVAGLSI